MVHQMDNVACVGFPEVVQTKLQSAQLRSFCHSNRKTTNWFLRVAKDAAVVSICPTVTHLRTD